MENFEPKFYPNMEKPNEPEKREAPFEEMFLWGKLKSWNRFPENINGFVFTKYHLIALVAIFGK